MTSWYSAHSVPDSHAVQFPLREKKILHGGGLASNDLSNKADCLISEGHGLRPQGVDSGP